MNQCKFRHNGFTLVEMMIGMLVGLLVSMAALSMFLGHGRMVYEQMSYNQSTADVSETYAVLSRLIMQAQRGSVTVTRTETGGVVTAVDIDMALPEGVSAWPNNTSPYSNNWVRIAWASSGAKANQVVVTNKSTLAALATETGTVIAGSSSDNNTRFTQLNLVSVDCTTPINGWCDLPAPGKFTKWAFSISGKAYARASDTDALGVTMEGHILPRN